MTDRDVSTDDPGDSGGDSRLTGELRDFLLAQGADLVGFGLVSHLAGAPDIMQPQRYLPDARSLIAIGLHINEASCDLIERSVHDGTIPPSYHSYQLFTLAIVNPQLDEIAFQGARFLERQRYRAYPFPANMPRSQDGGAAGAAAGCWSPQVATRTSRCPTKSHRPRNCFDTRPRSTLGKRGSKRRREASCPTAGGASPSARLGATRSHRSSKRDDSTQ